MPTAVSHITVPPSQRSRIYLVVKARMDALRNVPADSRASLLADILEEVVLKDHSEASQVASLLGHRCDEELFAEQWNRASAEIKSLMEPN